MTKYPVTYNVYDNTYIEVEANSPSEAEELANKEVSIGLCHYCSRQLDVELGEVADISEVK